MDNNELLEKIYLLDDEETQLEILQIIEAKLSKKESEKSQMYLDHNGDMIVKCDSVVFE